MNYLIVLLGPTGVGKTQLSIRLAKKYAIPILSADSRQIYRGIEIGTAAPTISERNEVPHFFVGIKDLHENYSAGQYEEDVLNKLDSIYQQQNIALMVGGSMLYIDAVCKGMDDIPQVDEETRLYVSNIKEKEGLEGIRKLLAVLDPTHYQKIDLKNPQRLMHAVEICLMTGKPYSSLLTYSEKKRDFSIIKIGLNRDRQELYQRINERVETMFEQGLEDEARNLYPFREYNALNTVGYKEIFDWIDGTYDTLEVAKEKIKQHSRQYAKRQLTWFNKDNSITWFHPDDIDNCEKYIESCIKKLY